MTRIHGGDAYNVIAQSVELGGTVRSFSRDVMQRVENSMRRVAGGTAAAFGAPVELDFRARFAPTLNDPVEAELAARIIDKCADAGACEAHNPAHDSNDRALPLGAAIFARTAQTSLAAD